MGSQETNRQTRLTYIAILKRLMEPTFEPILSYVRIGTVMEEFYGEDLTVEHTGNFTLTLLAALRDTTPVRMRYDDRPVPYPALSAFEATFNRVEVYARMAQVLEGWERTSVEGKEQTWEEHQEGNGTGER